MPEVILCRHCKQPINKETDQYVVIEKKRLIDNPKRLPMLRVNKRVLRVLRRSGSTSGYGSFSGLVDRSDNWFPSPESRRRRQGHCVSGCGALTCISEI